MRESDSYIIVTKCDLLYIVLLELNWQRSLYFYTQQNKQKNEVEVGSTLYGALERGP